MSQTVEITSALPASETSRFIVDGMEPQWAAEPTTAKEIEDLLRVACGRKWGLIPFGSGCRQGMGNVPARYDVALSLRKFDGIPEYEPQDLVVKVESGCRLRDLQIKLSEDNLFLPLDPPGADSTIGGIVAGNASGPLRLAHGTIRDLLLGVGVIQPDGTKTKFGARVVKNVTGYDMCKLYAGSFGTLGILTDFYLKLKPRPPCEATALGVTSDLSSVSEILSKVRSSPLSPLAIEFLNAEAAGVLKHLPCSVEGDPPYFLAVLFGEVESAVKWQIAAIKKIGEPLVVKWRHLSDRADQKVLWDILREDIPFVQGLPGPTVKLKISALPSQLTDLVGQLDLLKAKLEGALRIKSHAANGVTSVYFGFPDSETQQEQIRSSIEQMRSFLRPFRGSVVVESAPLALKSLVDVWGWDCRDRQLMLRIQQKNDPAGILNPGRFLV
jgi:glycolate oxidase FAD binding subunit